MTPRRLLGTAAVVLLAPFLLAGCGGGDDEPGPAAASSAGVTDDPTAGVPDDEGAPGLPRNTELQQPKAVATIKPSATRTAVPGASELPAPDLRTIQGFPVPPGVKVQDPGPLDDTWQFDVHSDDLDGLIDFYKRVLPQMGFTVRTEVTYTLGTEDVYWDLVFDGRVSGSMVRDPDNGSLFVVVNPPGQPAIAGEG